MVAQKKSQLYRKRIRHKDPNRQYGQTSRRKDLAARILLHLFKCRYVLCTQRQRLDCHTLMEKLYRVVATRVIREHEPKNKPKEQRWSSSIQIPTFYVEAWSIRQAEELAAEILGGSIDTARYEIESVHPCAIEAD
jgi:hypothetical protein